MKRDRIIGAALGLLAWAAGAASLPACESTGDDGGTAEYAGMSGDTAECEFDVLTFTVSGGDPVEVHINGLTVEELPGADKLGPDSVEMVTRRGVRFSSIFERGSITAEDDTPVNCVARDGWDPLRTRLDGDVSLLPTFAFMRDHAYVYVGSPGDKDPLYPQMEGRSLIVGYDLESDAEVPEHMGGSLAAMGLYRYMMVEKVDETQRGVFEVDPAP
jgi:hypothetical protein